MEYEILKFSQSVRFFNLESCENMTELEFLLSRKLLVV